MNPEDFLDTAAKLLLTTSESDSRSAISRAYYAVYHLLRLTILQTLPLSLLQNSGIGSKHQISYDKLPVALKNSSDATIAKIGESLQMLKLERTRADYRLDLRVSIDHAKDQCAEADLLRNELKAYGLQNLALTLKGDLEKTYGTSS